MSDAASTIPNPSISYVRGNVFVEMGLSQLPEESKIALLEQMNELIHKRTLIDVAEQLPEEGKQALDALAAGASPQEQLDTMMRFVPQFPAIVMQHVEQVKLELQEELRSVVDGTDAESQS